MSLSQNGDKAWLKLLCVIALSLPPTEPAGCDVRTVALCSLPQPVQERTKPNPPTKNTTTDEHNKT